MGERKIEKETGAGERKRETGMRERKIERQEWEKEEIGRERGGVWTYGLRPCPNMVKS